MAGPLGRALAVAAVAVAAFAQPAAAATDPVARAVVKAQRSGAITVAQRKEFLRDWRASGAAMNRLARSGRKHRSAEIAAVRRITATLVRRRQLSGDRMLPVFANVKATTYVMTKRAYPSHQQRLTMPWDSVTYGFYRGSGVQVQPLFTFARANTMYLLNRDDEFFAIVDRMEELAVVRQGVTTWEYYFPFGGGSPPWTSCMAQSAGTQEFARAYGRSEDPQFRARYLAVAQASLEAFRRHPRRGGCAVSEGAGTWYLLYSFNPKQRILNGHLQALIGLNDYHTITGDEGGRTLLNAGIAGVMPMLPKFDTGAWSRYDTIREADVGYHDFQTQQLNKLFNRTKIPQFGETGRKFAAYRITPPTIVVPQQQLLPVYPVKDGFQDLAKLKFFVDKRHTTTIRIRNSANQDVRTLRFVGPRGSYRLNWDGRDQRGRAVQPGGYVVHFTTTDIVGNRGEGQLAQPVEVRRDITPPQPDEVRVAARGAGRTVVHIRVTDSESPWVMARVVVGNKVVAKGRIKGSGRLVVARPVKVVNSGMLLLVDSSGNRREVEL